MTPKFRAWWKSEGEMVINISWFRFKQRDLIGSVGEQSTWPISFDDVVLMQSTGLFDKNGVEIFEGDVIRFTSVLGEDEIRQVTFENGCFGIMLERVHIGFGMIKFLSEVEYSLEIIGNIYENTELVQQETA